MCTVTYYPVENGFILTHNRDEKPARSPQHLTTEKVGSKTLIYPKDQQASGTWICVNSKGLTACLLNGAFENHEKKSAYRMSRGQVLLSLVQTRNIDAWLATIDLGQIEPFTMILYYASELMEFIWDGQRKYIRSPDPDIPVIWSSSTLYPEDIKLQRKQIFYQWCDNIKDFDPAAWMYRFHQVGSIGDRRNNILMYREHGPQTVSTTQVIFKKGTYQCLYVDRLNGITSEAIVKTKKINFKNTALHCA